MQEPTIRWELKFQKSHEWDQSNSIRRIEESFTVFVEAATGQEAITEAKKYAGGCLITDDGLRSLKRLSS